LWGRLLSTSPGLLVGFLVSLRHRSTLKEKNMVKVGKRKEGDGELPRFGAF